MIELDPRHANTHYNRCLGLSRKVRSIEPRAGVRGSLTMLYRSNTLRVLCPDSFIAPRVSPAIVQQTLAAVDELEPWRPVGDSAATDLKLVERILGVVVAHPGVLQSALRDHLPDADGRRLATLATWLEKAGRINRARSGKTWELSAVARK